VKAAVRIGTAAALAVGIALAISWVSGMDETVLAPGGEPMVVFSDHTTRPITAETVVDELASLELGTHIRRVRVSPSLLEIDLLRPDGTDKASVRADVAKLASLALAESDNIQRVFIRVFDEGGTDEAGEAGRGGALLVAATGAKADFSRQELQRLRDGEPMPEAWLADKMRLTETERWARLAP